MPELTLSDICARLRAVYGECSPSYPQVWRAAADGKLPAVRRGRSWYVLERDLDRVVTIMGLPARGRAA